MTHLEELRQQEKEILAVIREIRQATEDTELMIQARGQLRAVRTELSLVEQTK